MVCVYCGGETKVTNSRLQKRSNQVWRRRQCVMCAAVFTTHEVLELESTLSVNKKGQLEPFWPDLLLKELHNALHDRKDVYVASREVLATIIQDLLKQPQKPVFKPTDISKTAAEVLKRFDRSAYLHYLADHPSLQ
jgi:transcriptional repressor NrdR